MPEPLTVERQNQAQPAQAAGGVKTGKRERFTPKAETLAVLKVSGNPINGLGEAEQRRPSPFFWHPPALHPYGDLQMAARTRMSKSG